jgi:DNA-nicking Smr family endonuclease
MSKGRQKELTEEDRILWNRVAKTAKPLRGKKVTLLSEPLPTEEKAIDQLLSQDIVSPQAGRADTGKRKDQAGPHPFDAPTRNKLSKGRLPIEGRVDLHGMTQSEAYGLLLSFLHQAYAEGMRYVLVITGKGSSLGSEGALRRAVPAWLATQPFRVLVGSHDVAARHHGGAGALYVRLRRRDKGAAR